MYPANAANGNNAATLAIISPRSTASTGLSLTLTDIVIWQLPVALDGVSATIDGKAAALSFVSNTQLNLQAPDDTATGPVSVVGDECERDQHRGDSELATASRQGSSWSRQSTRSAILPDGTYVGTAGLLGASVTSRPAVAGDVVQLFGTGFGPTSQQSQAARFTAALRRPRTRSRRRLEELARTSSSQD